LSGTRADRPRRTRRLVLAATAGLAAYASTAALTPIANNDVWIHLTTGRLILEERTVPQTDRFSFTAEGARYVAHEWLAAVWYALGERAGGVPGIIVAGKLLPALGALAVLLLACRCARAPLAYALPAAVLVLTVARHRMLERPELIALSLLLGTLALLYRFHNRSDATWRSLAGLVPIAAVWANVHGSFPIGIVVVLVFAAAEAAELLLARRGGAARAMRAVGVPAGLGAAAWLWSLDLALFGRPAAALVIAVSLIFAAEAASPVFGDHPAASWRRVGVLVAASLAMLLSIAANPRGTEIYWFPFEFTAGGNPVTETVEEWKPLLGAPSLHASLPFPAFLAYGAAVAAGLGISVWRGRLSRVDLGLVLALAILPFRHARWMALFCFATLPALARMLSSGARDARSAHPLRTAIGGALLAASVVGLGAAVAAAFDTTRPQGGPASPLDPSLLAALALSIASAGVAVGIGLRGREPGPAGAAAPLAASALLTALACTHGIPEVAGFPRRPALAISALEPVAPVAFLRANRIPGKLYTEYELAGYAIHELWPDVRVFIDSRSEVYGPALLEEYRQTRVSRDAAARALDQRGADLVLVQYPAWPGSALLNAGVLGAIESDPRWALLYLDDQFVVYARRDVARALPVALDRIRPRHLQPEDEAKARPEYEAEVRRALERAPRSAVLRTALAISLRGQGRSPEARAELERAFAENPSHPASAYLAGLMAREAGEVAAARRWMERAARAHPTWDAPARVLRELESSSDPGARRSGS
jgi:hypothetical protein